MKSYDPKVWKLIKKARQKGEEIPPHVLEGLRYISTEATEDDIRRAHELVARGLIADP